jgi:hypothetical protein
MPHEGPYSASLGQTQIILLNSLDITFSKPLLNCFSMGTYLD